ncbi:MAG TPA: glycosyltransferase family 4 protein [Kiritimatiellia bacterium]|nr:glycosyltransferase family 4 protein [Kiritimatiellia bacterium]
MRIVCINQFFPPAHAPTGRLLKEVCDELAGMGHEVTVITSAGAYGTGSGSSDSIDEVSYDVIRLGSTRAHRSGYAAKLMDYAGFYIRAYRRLGRMRPRPEVVLHLTTPPFCGSIAAGYGKRFGVPYVGWCMDLYPEALIADGMAESGHLLMRGLARLASRERAGAAAVISLGPDMTERIKASTDACIEEVPVWSDLQVNPADAATVRSLRAARGWAEDEVVLLYSGNMGRAHRAEEFAALATAARGAGSRVRLVMSGQGPMREAWQQAWRDTFEWLEPARNVDVAVHLQAADIHLISQNPGWEGVVVPSKYQAACAVGRPVVFAGPPESAVGGWIREGGTGWILPPGDASAIACVLKEIEEDELRHEKAICALTQNRTLFDAARSRRRIAEIVVKAAESKS